MPQDNSYLKDRIISVQRLDNSNTLLNSVKNMFLGTLLNVGFLFHISPIFIIINLI